MAKVVIPASIEEATERLEGLGALLTATAWERAAIVYAFTELPGSGKASSSFLTCEGFAALGIHGLRSKDTVRLYHELWAEYGKAKTVKPGQTVTLPNVEFPPTGRDNSGHKTEAGMANRLRQMLETHGGATVVQAVLNVVPTEDIAETIALDDVLVRKIMAAVSHRHDSKDYEPKVRPSPDFDEIYQEAGATIVFREADKLAGRWTPNSRTEFIRHFLIQALNNSIEADAVTLAEETERYLKESIEA